MKSKSIHLRLGCVGVVKTFRYPPSVVPMDAREFFLTELRDFCRYESLRAEFDGFTWDDSTFLRTAIIRTQQGDTTAWTDFTQRLLSRPKWAASVRQRLESWGYLYFDFANDNLIVGLLPDGTIPFQPDDAEALLDCLSSVTVNLEVPDEPPKRDRNSQIMYIEYKGDALSGSARIGRVTFSQSRKTIYYNDCKLKSLKGYGYKANYYDSANGGWYWVSNCRSDGQDTLYPGTIEIDDDVREEYWTEIRKLPDNVNQTSFRSEGKYSKRRPQPEKPNHPASGPRS